MATAEPELLTVSEALRRAIASSGLPVVRIAIDSGVSDQIIGRFLRGDGLPLSAVDGLARVLKLELKPAGQTLRQRLKRDRRRQ
jgi:hypothetical protein